MRAHHQLDYLMEQARGLLDTRLELFDIYVEIRPIGKGRPREGHKTPQKTRIWTDFVRKCVAEQMDGKPAIDFPVSAKLLYCLNPKRKPDMDNIEKAIWDALQFGDMSGKNKAIADDRLIRGYVERGEIFSSDTLGEFIWVRFYAREGKNATNYMKEYEVELHNEYF